MVNISSETPNLIKLWANAISLRSPKLMSSFYCDKAVWVGTYSKPYELGKNQIFEYFKGFLDNRQMSCKIIEQTCQHNNNVIVSSGVYVFNVNGDEIKARFTYVIINVNGENKILTHNSAEYEG